jgi:hypothetical protein
MMDGHFRKYAMTNADDDNSKTFLMTHLSETEDSTFLAFVCGHPSMLVA